MSKNKPEATPQSEEKLSEKVNTEKASTDNGAAESTQTTDSAAGTDLDQRLADVEKRERIVGEREAAVEIREQHAEAKEKELEQLEEKLLSKSEAEEIEPGLDFELDGEKFKFLDTAPKTILFGGKARTQKQLIKDENALMQLVSNISLIEKIY